jgi:molecular chaperone DnaJ
MNDPYRVLGVSRDASDDEIKKAYRRLSRRYHPDANINNPKKEEAEEHFKEVQQAYDQIMKEREYGYTSSDAFSGFGQTHGQYQDEEAMRRQAAANYIQNGHFQEAWNVLSSLQQRNGEWYYLAALTNMGLGNNASALENMRTAVSLDPSNAQYRMMLSRMENGGTWYQQRSAPFGGPSGNRDDLCMNVCMANMACNLCCPGSGFFCI